jgi:sugar lactone lactonase YvrE
MRRIPFAPALGLVAGACALACAWAGSAACAPADSARSASSPARADSAARAPSIPGADSLARAARDTLPGRIVPAAWVLDGAARGPRLVEPSGIAIDAFGRFVVSDAAAHRVLRYDKDGAWLGEEGSLGSDPGQLRRPSAVVALGSLGTAVLDRENRRVVSYDLMGRRIGVLVDLNATALTAVTGRIDAITLASDRGGALYVADAARDRILAFDFSGRFLLELGGYGTRSGAFQGLSGLATTPRGEIIACERGGKRVQHLDAGGRVVRSWPLAVAPGRMPLAVAADDSSRVAVADAVSGRLWVFDRAGKLWAARHDLGEPRALAFAPDGTLLVAEGGAGRVRRFTLDLAPEPAGPGGD